MKRVLVAIGILLATVVSASSQQTSDRVKATDAYGQVQKRVSRSPERWTTLAIGDFLPADSAVRTSDSSAVLLQTADGHSIRVGAASTVELKEVGKASIFSFQLIAGEVWSFVNKAKRPAKFEVDTPTAVLGVRGTIFHVAHDEAANESSVSVNEGAVSLSQDGATQDVEKGFEMSVRPKQLAQTRPAKMGQGGQDMWKLLLKENWAKADGKPKLNKDADPELKRVRQKAREALEKKKKEDAKRKEEAAKNVALEKARKEAAEVAAKAKAAREAQIAAQKEARSRQLAAERAAREAEAAARRGARGQRGQPPARGGRG